MTKDTPFYSLTDLISLEKLQQIQDAFAESNQVAATITEIDGTPITRPSNHSLVCTMIRATEAGMKNCMKSGRHLGLEAAKRMKPFHTMCLSCGFTDAAAPIFVDGNHIANWLIGQYHVRDVDEHRIRQYAQDIGADPDSMAAAFREMPKLTEKRFESILSFLWLMANEISNMGYLNLVQKKQTEELRRVRIQLEKHQTKLEEMIRERTADLLTVNDQLSLEIERKNRIQSHQSRLIAAIENTVEAIIITDTTPSILYVNPAFERITGYTSEEAIGKNPNIQKSGLHDRGFYQQMWQTLARGEVWKGRLRNRKKNGNVYDEDTTISPVMNTEGTIISYVCVKRDITKELELERQLLQANKLESIGTLAAGIAHEINTPVQYVSDNTRFIQEAFADIGKLNALHDSLLTMLAEKGVFVPEVTAIRVFEKEIDLEFLTDEMENALTVALEGLDRIGTIVKAMKDFAHPGDSGRQLEDINTLIENTVTVSQGEWRSHADVTLALSSDLPLVPMVSGQIKQVILNLIVNASQAIAAKKSAEGSVMGRITISSQLEDDCVKISVSDTGTGIPAKIIDKIFDPFFTTKGVGKGTGQGLSLAFATIVEGHGGTIEAKSIEGLSTDIILTLPLRHD